MPKPIIYENYSLVSKASDNLSGKIFNGILVNKRLGVDTSQVNNQLYYECICICGEKFSTVGSAIKRGVIKSCGCLRETSLKKKVGKRPKNFIDYSGQVINNIKIIGESQYREGTAIKWKVRCKCGDIFYSVITRIKSGRIYCCKKCRPFNRGKFIDYSGQTINNIFILNYIKNDNNKLIWKCQCFCGKIFYSNTTRLKHNKKISCGCWRAKKRGDSIGDRTARANFSRCVFIRDRYICQICLNVRKRLEKSKLNAHHLYTWKNFPEKRFDTNNGVCLCEGCHKEFHRLYSKSNNTPEQFYEFQYNKTILI